MEGVSVKRVESDISGRSISLIEVNKKSKSITSPSWSAVQRQGPAVPVSLITLFPV
jgi:hypothetical protein